MYLNNFMVFNGCMVSFLRHGDEGLPETLAKISSHAMKNLTDKKTWRISHEWQVFSSLN